ncbi:MAG: aminotransferase class IV [bacterium]|jgi:4-amino-4-deoxychorismate lyase
MCQFIETIRVEYGKLMALNHHQQRVNSTLIHFDAKCHIDLQQFVCPNEFSHIAVLKCRVLYDLKELLRIEFMPYAIKSIYSVGLVGIHGKEYSFKYADRAWINDLVTTSGKDEIIMCDQHMIKDASYANLAFYNGHKWITPAQPLLKGTRREQLLNDYIIHAQDIYVDQLHHYSQVKFINAMMTWEESPSLNINNLTLSDIL